MEHEYFSAAETAKLAQIVEESGLLRNPGYLALCEAMRRLQNRLVTGILVPCGNMEGSLKQEYDKGTVYGITTAMGWGAGIVESAKKMKPPGEAAHQDEEEQDNG